MTNEAIARLEALLGNAEAAVSDGITNQRYGQGRIVALKDAVKVIAALSCCACGEPLAEVNLGPGRSFKNSTKSPVRVIILPADEEGPTRQDSG